MDESFALFDPWAVKSAPPSDVDFTGFGFGGYEDLGLGGDGDPNAPFSFTNPTENVLADPSLWMRSDTMGLSAMSETPLSLHGDTVARPEPHLQAPPRVKSSPAEDESPTSPEPVSFPFLAHGYSDSSVNARLDTLAVQLEEQNRVFSALRSLMVKLVQDPSASFFEKVKGYMTMATETLDDQRANIDSIYEEHVLSYHTLLRWEQQNKAIRHQIAQLGLLKHELMLLTDAAHCSNVLGLAALFLVEEPCADVLFKGKAAQFPYQVSVMTAATVSLEVSGPVSATVLCDTQLWKNKHSRKPFSDQSKEGLDVNNPVSFDPKFQVGTRKSCVTLRFSVNVLISSPTSPLTSSVLEVDSTAPMIVITNECQWVQAQRQLLISDIFGKGTEVTWPRFANKFSMHWLKMTRQSIDAPERVLTPHDLKYVHEKLFDSQPTVTLAMMESFWGWLGKGMHILRYQKSVGNMWKNGLFYGLMSKEESAAAVAEQQSGAFIVRFSERHAGSFAVAYKHLDMVKHYLIRSTDLVGRKRSLADFLWDCPQFVYVLQLCVEENGTGGVYLMCVRKDEVLHSYIVPQQALSMEGYEDLPTPSYEMRSPPTT